MARASGLYVENSRLVVVFDDDSEKTFDQVNLPDQFVGYSALRQNKRGFKFSIENFYCSKMFLEDLKWSRGEL